jgi:hypothetical protein
MASQENKTSEAEKEKQKKVLAAVLFVLLGMVFYFQDPLGLFTSEEDTSPGTVNAQARVTPSPKVSPTPRGQADDPNRVIDQPLNIAAISAKFTPVDGSARNIFVYPPPTPPPTPKPTPTPIPPSPPPTPDIVLVGIQPTGVVGRTGDFPLTVTALKFPADARVYVEGREVPTTVLDESHVKANVPAEMIRNPGNLGVMVRSIGDAKVFSNQVTLNVAEPPRPPFKYVGLIVTRQAKIGVLKPESDDDPINVREGESFGSGKKWKVVSINAQRMEILDNDLKIPHTINFTAESNTP